MGEVVKFALSQPDLSPTERLMLIALVTHRNPRTGYATPSMAQLAKDCGVTPRGARKILAQLERRGFIQRFYRRRADGRDNTNVYRLPFFALHQLLLRGTTFRVVQDQRCATDRYEVAA
jgi:hypothetical protein